MKVLMDHPILFNAALWAAPVVNHLPRFMKYNDLDAWGKDENFLNSRVNRLTRCGRKIKCRERRKTNE